MKVLKATVLINTGRTDLLSLETDLPSPFMFNPEGASLSLNSEVSPGKGVVFARTNFPDVPICVVDVETGTRTQIAPDSYIPSKFG